jgi:diguanylate cyclase (GGDEF)-like protein
MLDIDQFKEVNDVHGHLAGDQVLVCIARNVGAHLRPYDAMFRYGGDEFLLCLPDTEPEGAVEVCGRLRAELESLEHRVAGGDAFPVTVSIGIAELEGSLSVEDVLDRADRALFAAKAAGRNRVVVWEPAMAGTGAMPHSGAMHPNLQ